jgi:4-diphosphocytidyl-2-C-methyl-D-erythritol kinase
VTEPAPVSNPAVLSAGVTVAAPAKVNLVLRILDRRPDGYHNLWSIMQTVGLEDVVHLRVSSRSDEVHLRCNTAQLSVDHSNLVHRAAAAVLERAQKRIGLDIELEKNIPMGAGLGGGSSDAAATIVGLNRLLQLGWSQTQMAEVGQPLGSDVPFFLFAPSAVVSGRGEAVKPIGVDGVRWIVLINPGFAVETRWAYHELASTRSAIRPLSQAQLELDRQSRVNWARLTAAAENDFEAPVFARHEALREIKDALVTQGAEVALLSGSGATVFGLFPDDAAAQRAHAHFNGDKQLKTFVVPTCFRPLTVQERM